MTSHGKITAIVVAIIKDLTGRRGLRQAWEEIDDETRGKVEGAWCKAVQDELNVDISGSDELQRQAVALVKQYGMVLGMAPPVKEFFKRLAVFMKWEKLEKAL